MAVVRASGLGVSSTSTAQTWPAYGLVSMLGQWISASGRCPAPMPGWAARMRRSECHHAQPLVQAGEEGQPQPGGQDGADVGQAGERGAGGGVAQPGGAHACAGEPALGGAGAEPPGGGVPCAPPPGGDRAQPRGLGGQRGGEQVVRSAVVLGAHDQAVDVSLAEPHRACIRTMRRSGRGGGRGGLVKLSRHDSPVITHVLVISCPGVAANARDVTDFVPCAERAERDARAP